MQKEKIELNYSTGDSISELSTSIHELAKETILFAQNAYAPYSEFKVSAGLLLENGKIYKGANVENASYPVSICAERTLISYVTANFPKEKIKVLLIYVDKDLENPVPPCGVCRQTLLELELRQEEKIQLILLAKSGAFVLLDQASDLLPLAFTTIFLG